MINVDDPSVCIQIRREHALHRSIFDQLASGTTIGRIAKDMGVSYWTVYEIVRRAEIRCKRRLERAQRAEINRRLLDGESYVSIAKVFSVHRSTVMRIAKANAFYEELDEDTEPLGVEFKETQPYQCPVCERVIKTTPCVVCYARQHR
jgi:IS30 family transposase